MFRGQRKRKRKSRAALCDNSQRDAGAACWDRGLQKKVPCLRLSAMFNWNRTCPWKGIHRFGEIKCSIWTNEEMTTLRIVKVQTLELFKSCHCVSFTLNPPTPPSHPLSPHTHTRTHHTSPHQMLPSVSSQVHIRGFRWVFGLRGILDISSCKHTCPPSWSPSSPGSPSGSIMMPPLLVWP